MEEPHPGVDAMKLLDIEIECGIYAKSAMKRALERILTLDAITQRHFKLIVAAQKAGQCRVLVHKLLFKFKPLFDISATCTTFATREAGSFELWPYEYEQVVYSCTRYVPNDSYFNFVKNYDATLNRGETAKLVAHERFLDDMLRLMDVFEAREKKKKHFRRFIVRESLMFFVRDKVFNDAVRFQIFWTFKRGKLDGKISTVITDAEMKWEKWRSEGFPRHNGHEGFRTKRQPAPAKVSECIGECSMLEAFLNEDRPCDDASKGSLEWYSNRTAMFEGTWSCDAPRKM